MENREKLISKEETTKENRIWIRISSACNNKCIFCLDENAQDGTLVGESLVKEGIAGGYKEGIYNRIIISGGEASINPKFSEYITYAKSIGYKRIQTITNGNMFASESFCKKVFDAGLQEVTFSFHGHIPLLHDYLVDVPGAFKKSLKGLLYVKKFYPNIIVNIDIVVNKVNVPFLPDIIIFFMRLGVYEFDILHIIPFGRGFNRYKDILFFDIEKYLEPLHATWKLSQIPGMYMWTNRFPVEAFEGYEDLIQDPRKIKAEVMGEGYNMYSLFITSKGQKKPSCYGEACKHCFLEQYCHDFINHKKALYSQSGVVPIYDSVQVDYTGVPQTYIALRGEEFPSTIYKKYGASGDLFKSFIQKLSLSHNQYLLNVPLCIRRSNNKGEYEFYPDIQDHYQTLEDYTKKYIINLYRKKSIRCRKCKYNEACKGISINFIRSYGFKILEPILS